MNKKHVQNSMVLIIIFILTDCLFSFKAVSATQQENVLSDKQVSSSKTIQNKIIKKRVWGFLKLADGSKCPLIFEDGKYTRELIDEIVADINLGYSRFDKHQISSAYYSRTFKIEGRDIKSKSYFDITMNKGYYRPDPLAENFGFMVEIDDKQHIVISKTLINEYDKALRFKKEHKEAFRKLDEFIQNFNNMDNIDDLSNDDLESFYYFDHLAPSIKDHVLPLPSAAKIIFTRYSIRWNSLLNVRISQLKDESFGLLIAEMLLTKRNTNMVIGEIPLVYSNSMWKAFYIWSE